MDVKDITDIPDTLRTALIESGCTISTLKIIEKLADPDGTVKYLFETSHGHKFEAVLLGTTDKTVNRFTVCVSSQSGCKMGCTFCATSKIPMDHNLTAAEICEQINLIARDSQSGDAKGIINNVVYRL
jgi:23S rRNA (adenine2503-C2)-methyltransferase